jgi:hypothetical protein
MIVTYPIPVRSDSLAYCFMLVATSLLFSMITTTALWIVLGTRITYLTRWQYESFHPTYRYHSGRSAFASKYWPHLGHGHVACGIERVAVHYDLRSSRVPG